jgi:hypothetical protein
MISDALLETLQEEYKKNPLQEGEFRRIVGMGSHYACLTPTHEGDEYFFSTEVGGQKVYIYTPIE